MNEKRTVAFQVPAELFEQFKEYLKQNHLTQSAFFLDCIHRALAEAQEEREAAETVDGGGDQPLEEDCTPSEAATEPDGEAEVDSNGQDEDTEESGTAE